MAAIPFPCNGILLCLCECTYGLLIFFNKLVSCPIPYFNLKIFSIEDGLALALKSFGMLTCKQPPLNLVMLVPTDSPHISHCAKKCPTASPLGAWCHSWMFPRGWWYLKGLGQLQLGFILGNNRGICIPEIWFFSQWMFWLSVFCCARWRALCAS